MVNPGREKGLKISRADVEVRGDGFPQKRGGGGGPPPEKGRGRRGKRAWQKKGGGNPPGGKAPGARVFPQPGEGYFRG